MTTTQIYFKIKKGRLYLPFVVPKVGPRRRRGKLIFTPTKVSGYNNLFVGAGTFLWKMLT